MQERRKYDALLSQSVNMKDSKSYCKIWVHYSRFISLVLLIVFIFAICVTQEFTYVLNFHAKIDAPDRIDAVQYSRRLLDNRQKSTIFSNLKNSSRLLHETDRWHKIDEGIYAYSAYWDDRLENSSFVRIIAGAIINNSTLMSLKCLLAYEDMYIVDEVSPEYKILIEHHFRESRAIYVLCPSFDYRRPSMVALVEDRWNTSWNRNPIWMKVRPLRMDVPRSRYGVCVRPLFNYTDAFRVAEFIGYYEALGFGHFVFYNHSLSKEIGEYLRYLQREGYSIDLLPWNLPDDLGDMWALGQIAAINDCLYRSMSRSTLVAVVDMDEFLTPRHAMTVRELVQAYHRADRNFASFLVRSCVFCPEYESDPLPDFIPPFVTQRSVRRESRIYPYRVRTKYLARPDMIEVAGVHNVWEPLPGAEEFFVPASHALVHHYRALLCPDEKNVLEKGRVDPMARKFLNNLLRSKSLEVWQRHFSEGRHTCSEVPI